MVKRSPNRLKFSMVMSDLSKIEGTMVCDDDQWNAMFLILMGKVSPHVVMQAEAEAAARPMRKKSDAPAPLSRCAANRDGECHHPECPQFHDREPATSGRHCPLDNHAGDDE